MTSADAPPPHGQPLTYWRIGRTVELDVADDTSDAALEDMCEKLLANTVIENYRIEKLG